MQSRAEFGGIAQLGERLNGHKDHHANRRKRKKDQPTIGKVIR